jgi:hypothetical protein
MCSQKPSTGVYPEKLYLYNTKINVDINSRPAHLFICDLFKDDISDYMASNTLCEVSNLDCVISVITR